MTRTKGSERGIKSDNRPAQPVSVSNVRCTSLLEDGDRGARTNFWAGGFDEKEELRNGLLTASGYRGAWREWEGERERVWARSEESERRGGDEERGRKKES
jgi:hypothetical protein